MPRRPDIRHTVPQHSLKHISIYRELDVALPTWIALVANVEKLAGNIIRSHYVQTQFGHI